MTPIAIASIVLVCVFGGALLGMFLRTVLPEEHLSESSKDIVKLVTGLIATLAALVLGLLIASAKNSFDSINEGFRQSAAKIILLDRALAQYGPETKDLRELLRRSLASRIEQLFSGQRTLDSSQATAKIEGFQQKLRELAPQNDAQRSTPVARTGSERRCGADALAWDRARGQQDSRRHSWSCLCSGLPPCSQASACSPPATRSRSLCCSWARCHSLPRSS